MRKMYHDTGAVADVHESQIEQMLEGGWTKKPVEEKSKSVEEKESVGQEQAGSATKSRKRAPIKR